MPNDLVDVIPQILAQGLMALRSTCVMPQLVNSDYGEDAKAKGETVDVPIPSAVPVQDVVPGPYSDSTPDLGPTTTPITLDMWKEAPFQLSDKDIAEAMDGIIPMQASEAIKSLAMAVNADIFSNYIYIGGGYGTPGSTPFETDTKDVTQTRKVLNNQFAPVNDRRFVVDPDAEANLLNLRAFQDYAWGQALDVIRGGNVNEQRLGFDWFMDQQVPMHTAGDAAGATVNGAHTAGVKTKSIAISAGTGTFNAGDIITFAGSAWQYAVTSTTGSSPLTISPALQEDLDGGEAITLQFDTAVASPQNLAFQRDCFGFASRPLIDETEGLGNIIQSAIDPVSGLALRLEVSREHKRTRWSFDLLWGSDVVRAELGTRCFG